MEPERDIEKLLRAYANKRRKDAGAPSELDPVSRRLLQGEVARRHSRHSRRSSPSGLFSLFRLRYAATVCALAIALSAFWVVSRSKAKKETRLAAATSQTEESSETIAMANEPAPAPLGSSRQVAASPPEVDAKNKDAATSRRADGNSSSIGAGRFEARLADSAELVSNQYSLGANLDLPGRKSAGEKPDALTEALHGDVQLFKSLPGAAPAEASTETGTLKTDNLAAAKAAATWAKSQDDSILVSQRFVQVEPDTDKRERKFTASPAAASSPVLARFEVQQNGAEVNIVDNDGSIYKGSWQSMNEKSQLQTPGGAGGAGSQAWTPNYAFRVSGTNRSLNQSVVFSGNLLTPAPVLNANTANAVNGFKALNQSTSNLFQLPLANARVNGTATIDNRKEIQVNAVPSTP